jgi:cytochrome b562
MITMNNRKSRAIPIMLVWATCLVPFGLTPVMAATAAMITARTSQVSQVIPAILAQQPAPRPFPFMTEMEQIFRELRAQIGDPKENASSLEMVGRLRQNSIGARDTVPPMIAKLPPAQQPSKLAAYKQQMTKLISQEDELQKALSAGQNLRAVEIFKAIEATRKAGHDQFRPSGLGRGR